ncbi:MAG: homoserine O-acetyltransferase [Gammaproteobacteria bacterium]|nr:homoserine O-acetyltransferase [Gammaproteobacteria bacterium]
MVRLTDGDSVGLVEPRVAHFDQPFTLQCRETLPRFDLVYETYGELNAAKSNAVLVCHALSGDHHAAGYHTADDTKPGWWDVCIGPGKPIDTTKFFVVALNNLGGCNGSTGPRTVDPGTGEPYGENFPTVTVKDWVKSQAMLADALGIDRFAGIVGGSLGGMQALQWAIDYPDRIEHALVIAGAAKLSAQNIAFNEIARQAIQSDPEFHGGRYYQADAIPRRGLMLARMVGHVTYLSDDSMGVKFGRELKSGDIESGQDVQFQVESYLHYQGTSFSERFDANTYLLMTRALDYFDPALEFDGDLVRALSGATAKFLVLSFTSDWRFPPARSNEIVDALIEARKDVVSATIDSPNGHDSFLLPNDRYFDVLGGYLDTVAQSKG